MTSEDTLERGEGRRRTGGQIEKSGGGRSSHALTSVLVGSLITPEVGSSDQKDPSSQSTANQDTELAWGGIPS